MRFEPFQRRLQAIVRTTVLQHQLLLGDEGATGILSASMAGFCDPIIAVVDRDFMLLRQMDTYREQWQAIFRQLHWRSDFPFTFILQPVIFTRVFRQFINDERCIVKDPRRRSLVLQLWHLEQNKTAYLEWLLRDHVGQLSARWRATRQTDPSGSIETFLAAQRTLFYEKILALPALHDDFKIYRHVVRELVAGQRMVES